MADGFKFDSKGLMDGLLNLETKGEAAVAMYAQEAALDLEGYMKDHAPWTDRTGQARQRLSGRSSRVEKGYRIALAQGVDYGIFLELAHEKRFAIIQPTILSRSGEVMGGFHHLIERIK